MNRKDELLRYHARSAADYIGFFFNPAAKPHDMSVEEAAYYLLAHTGMVLRYSGDETSIQDLIQHEPEARKGVVTAACRYIAGMTLEQQAKTLFEEDMLEPEELEQAEVLLMRRDEVECALDFAVQLTDDQIETDAELRRALAVARCDVSDLDEVLRTRPDIISVASRVFAGIADCIETEIDTRSYWWLYEAPALDRDFEKKAASILQVLAHEITERELQSEKDVFLSLAPAVPKKIREQIATLKIEQKLSSLAAMAGKGVLDYWNQLKTKGEEFFQESPESEIRYSFLKPEPAWSDSEEDTAVCMDTDAKAAPGNRAADSIAILRSRYGEDLRKALARVEKDTTLTAKQKKELRAFIWVLAGDQAALEKMFKEEPDKKKKP